METTRWGEEKPERRQLLHEVLGKGTNCKGILNTEWKVHGNLLGSEYKKKASLLFGNYGVAIH